MRHTVMPSVFDTLTSWARRTTTSFAELRLLPRQREEAITTANGLIYRLKHWPELPSASRTADVYRALSVMSNRPVNRHWILTHSRLRAHQVDSLLQQLVDDDAVEVIDASRYAAAGTQA